MMSLAYVARSLHRIFTRGEEDKGRGRQRRQELSAWPSLDSNLNYTECSTWATTGRSSSSRLLALPVELRLLVYDYIFDFSNLHLLKQRDLIDPLGKGLYDSYGYHLESFPCHDPSAKAGKYKCGCILDRGWVENEYRDNLEENLQTMMLVCREFYTETLNIIFRYRTFQIDELDTIVLASMTKSQRFDSIRSLYLDFQVLPTTIPLTVSISHLPKSYQQRFCHLTPLPKDISTETLPGIWNVACDIISNMTCLEVLKVQLCEKAFAAVLLPTTQNERFVFEPLQRIAMKRNLDVFKVEVDWVALGDDYGDDENGEELGFELVRRKFLKRRQVIYAHPRYVDGKFSRNNGSLGYR